ncbi:MAG TPA: ATP-binding protein, partial [Gallionella sp.]|nr:ATP-binding protein [Gallionella sp.]
FVEIKSHMLIESFCGFVALMIAALVLSLSARQKSYAGMLFGMAFLAMGIMDILHALSDPTQAHQHFVTYHTVSTLSGGVLILAGIVAHIFSDRSRWPTRSDLSVVGVGVLIILAVAALYQVFIPRLMTGSYPSSFSFSPSTHMVHYLAGALYALAAVAFYGYYRRHRQSLVLVIASLLMVFAQSAYLFSFSSLWNITWWMWHGVKLMFYLGVMVTVSIGFLLALNTIERSRHVLARANLRLQHTQRKIRNVNQELRIRNRMAREAMSSLDLNNALEVVSSAVNQLLGIPCGELILSIPADEVDEFERRMPQMGTHWPIRAKAADSTCFGTACQLVQESGGSYYECASGTVDQSVCLSLTASGQAVGHLRLLAENREHLRQHLSQLQALAVEIGTIVNNSLLYHRWLDANEFRAALLRVSAMMTSTLNLKRVLESVCRESAALLDSDGALVWLPSEEEPGRFTLAANWFADSDQATTAEFEAWCRNGRSCAQLLHSVDGQFRPRAMLWPGNQALSASELPSSCHWEALALFPLLDGERLIGAMVLIRKERVQFSEATLAKGELLAGQVRIAINNAHSYQQLAVINQQLEVAEADKIRADRLAVLGQMAASVAHEVRNPLSAITNCLAVLKAERSADSRSRAALEIIQDEVGRLDNLTRDFLTFGKPRVMASKPVVLEALVYKVCAALERHVQQQEQMIEVEAGISGNAGAHLFDAEGLEVVLWNLLLNASQAIHGRGHVYATVRVYPGYFLLVVADTGKGIPPEERKRIFEPFYTQRSHGAGLGLAIVQRFVHEWGGRIRIASREGHGTRFYVRVPLSDSVEVMADRMVAMI